MRMIINTRLLTLNSSALSIITATDSSRYFVLRISDGKGRNAIIGIGFNDRTQAFDFKVAVQDQLNGAKEAELPTTPAANLSLPVGGKIHINLGSKKEKKEKKDSGSLSSGMAGLKLAPPPAGGDAATTKKAPKEKKEKSAEKQASVNITLHRHRFYKEE